MPGMAPRRKAKPERGPWGVTSWTDLWRPGYGSGRRGAPHCLPCSPPHHLFPPKHGACGETARERGLAAAKHAPNVGCARGRQEQAGLTVAAATAALPVRWSEGSWLLPTTQISHGNTVMYTWMPLLSKIWP